MLEEHAEEALDGAEQGPVQHDRAVPGVVGADVLEVEALRVVEVALDRRQLPRPADGVAHVDVDLRAVEGGVTLLQRVLEPVAHERRPQRLGGLLPHLVGADVLLGILGRQVEREVVEAEGPQHREHEVEQRGDLVLQLLPGAEDVAVVHRQPAHPQQAVQRAGALVAVDRAQLEQPQRQLAIAALPGPEDQAVHRAVHRLHVVRAVVHLHRRVHAVGVPSEMAARLEQLRAGDVRRVDELVAARLVALAAVVLHQLADDGPLRMPDGETATELAREAEQVEVGGQPPMVALGRFGELLEVGAQCGGGLPGRAVDALQHRTVLVAAPVRPGDLLQLEVPEPSGRGDVRALAQVDELGAVAIHADRAAGGDLAGVELVGAISGPLDPLDDLQLVGLVGEDLVASSGDTSERTNGWSAAMISRILASIAARSSSLNVRPSGRSKS